MDPELYKPENNLEKIAAFIVDKRRIVLFCFIVLIILSFITLGWVNLNEDLTKYLDESKSEARQGLKIMEREFSKYVTADVMVANITQAEAEKLDQVIRDVGGVYTTEFDLTKKHYVDSSALFSVVMDPEDTPEQNEKALGEIKLRLAGYDTYIKTEIGNPLSETIEKEMKFVVAIAFLVVISVLIFTSKTYAEIPVLLIVFGVAAILNKGSNFIFGTISNITDSICVVLQLALAVDYAIILCHRFTEERARFDKRTAAIKSLAKGAMEISASSLTTIAGLFALTLMSYKLGFDIGMVLIKSILISMACVLILMPCLLYLFSGAMDKTHHKSFVPDISAWGRIVVKTRYIMPAVFIVLMVAAAVLQNRCPYAFRHTTLETVKQNEIKKAEKLINKTFGEENLCVLIIPSGDYEKERALVNELRDYPEIADISALSAIELKDGVTLTSKLSPKRFSELADIEYRLCRLLYSDYAISHDDYTRVASGIDNYTIPVIDVFTYIKERKDGGYINLDQKQSERVDELYAKLSYARGQLEGKDHSRFIMVIDLPEEAERTFRFIDTVHAVTAKYYDKAYIVGESLNARELRDAFRGDNVLIGVLSALFVTIVLLFNLKSVGLALLLIACIQTSIWINFSIPYIMQKNIFFIAYLIVSSIQMGANVDYAIIISSRYMDLKKQMPIRSAIITAVNQAFPTVITSGTMMATAGFLIGYLTSQPIISSIGFALGRGTVISMIIVLGFLPQILLLGDILIEKTGFKGIIARQLVKEERRGSMRIKGRVKGYVEGYIDAEINGSLKGVMNAVIEYGTVSDEEEKDDYSGEERKA